ncbi:MAG TPA: uroporphyrinogen-III synthase [Methanocorpusculum sp.]|nr:uroporphyrinogen-III synthase [Methanocorpusculum sp.]
MKIAITRLAEKGESDQEICSQYGHTPVFVHPLHAEYNASLANRFVIAANQGEFDAIFFTSAYPAKKLAPLLDRSALKNTRVIAIGPETQCTLHESGIITEILPSFYSKSLVPYLGAWIEGKSVGIPRADVPNSSLISSIEDAGGIVYEYRVYKLLPTNEILNLDGCDAVLFTSSSSFTKARLPNISGIRKLAIGEITAEAMRKAGVEPDVVGNGSLEGTLQNLENVI